MYHYLEEDIGKLRTRLIKMGSVVEEQINAAINAVFDGDIELAKQIIERDTKIDKYEVKIDKHSQKILALTQPVAFDLRLIISAMGINRDLERMGDCAVNIAKNVDDIVEHKDILPEIGLDKMAEQTKLNIKNVLDALINRDDKLAIDVIKRDDVVDRYQKELVQKIIGRMIDDRDLIVAGTNIINVISNLERLSDHATNIAEEIVFLMESRIIKHKKDILELNEDTPNISEQSNDL